MRGQHKVMPKAHFVHHAMREDFLTANPGRRPHIASRFKQMLLAMKLTTFLLLAAFLQLSARGLSQTLTLNEKNVPLRQVFQKIEKQTGYTFIYKSELLASTNKVSIRVTNASLDQVLDICFKDQPLSYKIFDKIIAVQRKESPGLSTETSAKVEATGKADIDITGRVTDTDGKPLEGATIKVQGTNITTATNSNGEFQLAGISERATLEISFVGYQTYTVAVNNKTTIVASLNVKPENLNEVVINKGYYTEKQKLSTGNVAQIKSRDIEKQPVNNPLLAMQARVPGLIVTQQSGVPGSGVSIQIRGRNSITMGNDPLFIIDGVPYSSQMLPNNGGSLTNGGNALNFIGATDIESISILKDADATAIYGSRGANGVVLISTKKGKSGDTKVDLNVYSGIGKIARKAKLLNTQQYLEVRNEAFANDAATPQSWDYDVNGAWDQNAYTDWQDKLIGGSANYTEARMSVSGGSETVQYLIAGAYHKETTVFPSDFNNQKTSVHFNINSSSLNKKFKILLSGSYLNDNNRLPYLDLTYYIYLAPNAPQPHKIDGSFNWDVNDDFSNPYSTLLAKYKTFGNTLVGNSSLSYQLLPNLEIKTGLGFSNISFRDMQTFPTTYFPPSYNVKNGSANFSNSLVRNWIAEPQLNYDKSFAKHRISLTVGASFQSNTTQGEMIDAKGYTNNDLLEGLAGAATITKGTVTSTQYKYASVLGRINYSWNERYLLNLTGRRDGSSRFGPGKQFANFGAVGAGWVFSRSAFFQKSLPFISFGKLRASYGTSGNDQISDYRFIELYSFVPGAAYQGALGLRPANLANPDYAWEVNKKAEVGLELGLFKDKVFISSSFFRNRSSNQLVGYPLPNITGFNNILANLPAVVENTGFEWQVNAVNVSNKKFQWTSSANLTIARNKLVSYPDFQLSPYYTNLVIGKPLNVVKAFQVQGVDATTGIFQFVKADGSLTSMPDYSLDRSNLVDVNPKYYAGIENSFKYGNFQLEFLFQIVKQTGSNYLFTSGYPPGAGYGYYNPPVELLDRWRKTGDMSYFQKYSQDPSSDASVAYSSLQYSNYALTDASFVRLKNASLSYQCPTTVLQKMRLSNLRLYINAQNLFTFTNYIGLDPENQSVNTLPPLRVMVAGIQVTL
jgi:TonB-linked SusC/RagA family outer membrane protein